MAVTRINNNQITDASAGNAYVGVNAASKVQNYTITSQKIANNLTYGSDLTVAGNLTVQGTTTTIDTVNTLIQDPMITLADGQTSGVPTLDIGTIGLRGSENSAVMAWKESEKSFVTALSNTTVSNTTFTISSYANLQTGNFTVQGTTSLVGNVIGTNTNFTGNITNGNLITVGIATVTGNITGGNLLTGGLVSATGNITTGANLIVSGYATVTGNIDGGNLQTAGLATVTGNITGGNLLTGGQLVSTQTGNSTLGAAQIYLNGAGNNRIDWNSNGTGAPTFTTRSSGAKLVLYPNIGAAAADYALGVDISTLWSGVPDTSGQFKWYAGNSEVGSLTGGGALSVTGNVTGANINTAGLISAVGNINGGNLYSAGTITSVGNITAPYFIGNIQGNIDAGGSNTQIQFNDNDILAGSSGFTFDKTANLVTVAGNVQAGNLLTAGLASVGGNITGGANLSITANITGGNLATGGTASVTGNVTGGNLLTGGLVSATANVTGGNLITGGLVSATANVIGGNLLTAGNVNGAEGYFTGNLTVLGNLNATVGVVYANSGIFYGNSVTGNNAAFAGVPGFTQLGSNVVMQFAGNVNAYSQLNFENINNGTQASTDLVLTADNGSDGSNFINMGITGSNWDGTQTNSLGNALRPNDGYLYTDSGNLIIGTTVPLDHLRIIVGGDNNDFISAEFHDPGTESANTTTGTLTVTGGIGATKNINGANIFTPGVMSSTGNVTGGNILTGGLIAATGAITGANITGANINTGGLITATGNITGGNVNTSQVYGATGLTLVTGSGLITLNPAGNVAMSSKNINNLADPVQDQDAATKLYVDTVAQGLDPKASVVYATAAALAAYTYNNGTAGVGATITANANGALSIDGSTPTAGDRVLVKNETSTNAPYNGIYTVTTVGSAGAAFVLTRSTDFNQAAEIPSAFTFVEFGSTNADTGWVCTTNAPVVMGTTDITFVQFSGAGSYTANTSAGLSLIGTQFNAKVDNITTAFDGGGNISVKVSANLTTPNIGDATGTSLSVTGNVTSGNLITGGLISATGTITSTANVTGGNITTAGQMSAGANITGANLLTGGIVSATGNLETGANLVASGYATVTGNITGANLNTAGQVVSTGNITGGNLVTGGTASVTGTITGGNLVTGGTASATGNITGGNLLTGGIVSATGNLETGANLVASGYATVTGNITSGNLLTGGLISATGTITSTANVTGGNLNTGGTVNATGNVNGTGAVFSGNVTAQNFIGNISGNIDAGGANTNIQFNDGDILAGSSAFTFDKTSNAVVASGNVTGGNILTGGLVSATGNIIGGNAIIGNAGGYGDVTTTQFAGIFAKANGLNATSLVQVKGNDGINGMGMRAVTGSNALIYSNSAIELRVGSTINDLNTPGGGTTIATIASTGLTVTGIVSATGNITGGNISTAGLATVTGNVIGGNLITAGLATVTGNVTGGNLITAGLATVTGNISSDANLIAGGYATVTGNVTGGNLITAGLATVTGNITSAANIQGANVIGGNIVLTGNSINELNPGGTIAVNGAGANTNFSVNGLNPNVFFVNALSNTASFGNSRQIANALVSFNTPTSILTPVGNTGQRPGNGETGMLRFNTTINNLEIFDNSAWVTVGTPSFTVIADEQFTGDATTTQFTLGSTQTTNSCIVSINGVLQIPNLAYSVSGTDPTCVLTFTEAPAAGDLIDVRQITTTTTVTSISNSSGNAEILANAVSANIDITGNMVTAGNVYATYLLGNGSQLTGIDATLIQNGNSTFSVISSGGNIRANIAGSTVGVFSSTGLEITGSISATNGFIGLDATKIANGTSQVSVVSANGNISSNVAGSTVQLLSADGANITGNVTASQGIVAGLQGYTNDRTYSANLTYPTDTTRMLVGPMTVNTGVTVTLAGSAIVVIL